MMSRRGEGATKADADDVESRGRVMWDGHDGSYSKSAEEVWMVERGNRVGLVEELVDVDDDVPPKGWEDAVKSFDKNWGMPECEVEQLVKNNAKYKPPPMAGEEDGVMNMVVLGVVGSIGQVLIRGLNRAHSFGIEKLYDLVEHREKGEALLTVSNHRSVLDDPLFMAGILPQRILWNAKKMRWGLCGVDICFKNRLFGKFLTLGRTLPLIRKGSLSQKPLYVAVDKLMQGEWIHMYPEGRVHQKGIGYFKRGVGKMVAMQHEAGRGLPTILPMYHEGMEKIMPQDEETNALKSKLPRVGQDTYLMIGDPMPVDDIFERLAPACHDAGGSSMDPPPCLRLYEEIADRLAHTIRLLRAELRKRVKREHGKVLGDPYEVS
eukprot:Plantae.Rhodophyta-Hildenbrandia_rubra.ctg731.p1 GENE.Plantae.Rhodophyta-Hildenbrandia_rubra.ctg731~~Plantae.Rhodophyta-Hildenbrandia_rubra.ctg731.p1  ORF type:complete len:378 (+),score=89.32 Plantae.Rhodophyta-Hildenbrandia_rubra.ctg731:457-1590(+)